MLNISQASNEVMTSRAETPEILRLRTITTQDNMIAAARQANLLAEMGLAHTETYRQARATYDARAREYHVLLSRLHEAGALLDD